MDHICWLHIGIKGHIFVNGELLSIVNMSHRPFDFVKEFRNETFDMMMRQEPDSWIGDFNPTQTLRGQVSEFNMWDFEMLLNMIAEIVKCKIKQSGHIAPR